MVKGRGKRNIFSLGFSSMFNDIGSEMITPVLPFYISSLGGSGAVVGLVSGLREGLSSLFKLLGGWLSDREGRRKPFLFLGYIVSFFARLSLILATTWAGVVSLVAVERVGKLRDAPRDTIVSKSTKKRGKGFAIHQTLDAVGGVIGVILVIGFFYFFGQNYHNIILCAAGISLLALIPLFFVKDAKSKKDKKSLFTDIHELDGKLLYFIFTAGIFTIANFGLYMFLILRAKAMTGSFFIPLILYAMFMLCWAGFSIFFGSLSDKIGRKKVLMTGYVLFFLVCFGFLFQDGLLYLAFLFVLYGIVMAMVQSNHRALVTDLSGKFKGTALGFYYFVVGIVNIPAGLIAGLLWDVSYFWMFVYLAIVSLIAVVMLCFVRERE